MCALNLNLDADELEGMRIVKRPPPPVAKQPVAKRKIKPSKAESSGWRIPQLLNMAFWSRFLTSEEYKPLHAGIITVALLVHLFTHYATYFEALRPIVGSLPYFRLHILHEAEFLLILVYTTLVFRARGGVVALIVTAVTSIPFILTPYIFGRTPLPDELRDNSIQVAFIILMGSLMIVFYEAVAKERERRMELAKAIEEKNHALEQRNREISGMNVFVQTQLNNLYGDLRLVISKERAELEDSEGYNIKTRYSRFLSTVTNILDKED